MTPAQLRELAAYLRGTQPVPSMGQTPSDYTLSAAIHALANGIDHLADNPTPGATT